MLSMSSRIGQTMGEGVLWPVKMEATHGRVWLE